MAKRRVAVWYTAISEHSRRAKPQGRCGRGLCGRISGPGSSHLVFLFTGTVPELPDVEAYRRFFQRHGSGRTVRSLAADPTILRNTTTRRLGRALHGKT